jgi:D-3-phosphoglycerate dehydrogenase
MNAEQISKMKPGSILINTSRGEMIDEEALFKALKEKRISGAGLDVFEKEPYSGPLTELNNVVLTPHIGAYAKELRIQMEIEAVENLIRGLNEE